MKITALRNFLANNVKGFPGHVLSSEDSEAISNIQDEMLKEGLIQIEQGQPAPELPGSSGILDDGPNAKDDLPDAPTDDLAETIQDKPKKKKK